jgi:hypothetical protein
MGHATKVNDIPSPGANAFPGQANTERAYYPKSVGLEAPNIEQKKIVTKMTHEGILSNRASLSKSGGHAPQARPLRFDIVNRSRIEIDSEGSAQELAILRFT